MNKYTHGDTIDLDVKSVAADGSFWGYASTFGNTDRGNDVVMAGAFKNSLEKYPAGKVKLLWQHDTSEPVGVWKSLTEDAHGLRAEGQLLLDTNRGREAYALMKAGALDGLSIGFKTIRDEVDRKSGVRRLHEVELREISLVTFPMNEDATITGVKSTNKSFRALVEAINAARAKFKD